MAWFALSPGCVDCPKCGGWGIIDTTKRGPAGWPLGDFNINNCDHCNGTGEIKSANAPVAAPTGWGTKPKVEPAPIWDIDDPEPPAKVSNGWDIFNG